MRKRENEKNEWTFALRYKMNKTAWVKRYRPAKRN